MSIKPKATKNRYRDSSSEEEDDGEASWGAYDDEEYGYDDMGEQYAAPTTSKGGKKDYTNEQWDQEANIKYETVLFGFDFRFRPSDLLDGKVALDDGKIVLSLNNKRLFLDEYNPEDFRASVALESATTTNGGGTTPLDTHRDGRKHHHHHRKPRRRRMRRDIAKAAELVNATTTWPELFSMEMTTVDAMDREGFGRSDKVVKTFMPHELKATKPTSCKLFERCVTNRQIEFYNSFQGTHLESFDDDVTRGRDYSQIPLKHPFWMYHDKFEKPLKAYGDQNFISVKNDVADTYMTMAKEQVKGKIQPADITSDPVITLGVKPSEQRRLAHEEWLATKGARGEQWKNFADILGVMSADRMRQKSQTHAGKTEGEVFLNTEYRFSGKVRFHYRQFTGEPIALNMQ
jgi:hypothetical protein